jgi:mycofactocin system glycosyltransferase
MAEAAPPPDFRLEPDDSCRLLNGGRVLLGGQPPRLMRLSPAGGRAVEEWWAGGPIGAGRARAHLARRLLDAGMAHPLPPSLPTGAVSDVVVVVPTRDRPSWLGDLLSDLGRDGPALVVVDDGSAEPEAVARMVAQHGGRLLRRPTATGPGAARNLGWQSSAGAVVVFLDDDCRLPEGWAPLASLLAHFGDPAVAAVAPRLLSTGGGKGLVSRYEDGHGSLDRGNRPAPVRPGSLVPFVPAAALAVRREALAAVGGFDPALGVGEDVDLVWRLHEAGLTVRYDPTVVVRHRVRPRLRDWARQRHGYGTSAAALDRRHPGAVAPVQLSPWTAMAWALLLTASGPGTVLGAAVMILSTLLLRRRLAGVEGAGSEAVRLGIRGQLATGRSLAYAARGAAWPLWLLYWSSGRRRRWLATAAWLEPLAQELRQGLRQGRLPGPAELLLRLADDFLYGTGVWTGALRHGRWGPVVPRLSSWGVDQST